MQRDNTKVRAHAVPVLIFFCREMLELIVHVAKGLAFLHDSSVSVIHRDIKPANVLINEDPDTGKLTAKLADFGLSVLVYGRKQQESRLQAVTNDK